MKPAIAATLIALSLAACGQDESEMTRTPSPADAKVFFIEPADGATVTNPVTVKFGIEGMEVAPAGTEKPNAGHHHVLVDTALEDYDAPIPSDDRHKHFGKGQTETQIELTPGEHTLQLILGDQNHIPHDPVVESESITVTVE